MRAAPRRPQTSSDQRRDGRRALVAVAIAVGFLVAVPAIVVVVVPDVLSCSPPSDKELVQQEAFVRAHVSDARDVRSGVGDCDDAGRGYVNFTTSLSATAARDVLLTDPSCSGAQEADGETSVQCRSSKKTVDVYFTANMRGGTTAGELNFK